MSDSVYDPYGNRYISKRFRGKRPQFIHVQRVERPGLLRQRDAFECCKIELGDNERAGEVAVHLANLPFGEVGDKDFVAVHEVKKVYGALLLTKDVAHDKIREKPFDFVLNGRNGFLLELLLVFWVFDLPEGSNHWIGNTQYNPFSVFVVYEKSKYSQERSGSLLKKCRDRIVENALHPRSPGVAPHAFKRSYDGLEPRAAHGRGGRAQGC